MDDDGLNMRNWGYYDPSPKGHLGLQLMSSVADRDVKPFLTGRDNSVMMPGSGAFHRRDGSASGPPDRMDFVKDSWINHGEKFIMYSNHYNAMHVEPLTSQPMQIPDIPAKDVRGSSEEPGVRKEVGPAKKRTANATPKTPKSKKPKNLSTSKEKGEVSVQRAKAPKKSMDVTINGIDMDISGIPIPVCSCTSTPQQCYRWGCGGWQSACCTTSISMYPLPMSTKRRGARIAGRKMSQGAFKKVLEKLASEGYNFANPIDLRSHWAKHGTNKFVTIR
ncbi:hypothetical protein LIER_28000 [Lithospermum erythrorhizon]|uniref:GAGA-binding transcriptional activator n=1 Tax=Lithospermum erythrorhizon TaxID=34254 RepID=A0AAV3RH20_LITER